MWSGSGERHCKDLFPSWVMIVSRRHPRCWRAAEASHGVSGASLLQVVFDFFSEVAHHVFAVDERDAEAFTS